MLMSTIDDDDYDDTAHADCQSAENISDIIMSIAIRAIADRDHDVVLLEPFAYSRRILLYPYSLSALSILIHSQL